MPGHYGQQRTSVGNMLCVFLSCLACLYVAGRLWTQSRELVGMERHLEELHVNQHRKALESNYMTNAADAELLGSSLLHVSSRPYSGPGIDLQGDGITKDLPMQDIDLNLIGQVDTVEAGVVKGWACVRGQASVTLQVQVYVDGKKVGEVPADEASTHHIVRRLCGLDAQVNDIDGISGKEFELKLPELSEGRHEVRGFVKNVAGTAKQELNQSPLPFLESKDASGSQELVKRKDAIIRVRNAQIAALWNELHIKQPWRNALQTESRIGLPDDKLTNETRALAVIAINSGIGVPDRRASLRKTWVKTGEERLKLEAKGIFIRFVVGYSESPDHPDEDTLRAESKEYGDILRLDTLDTYEDLSAKTIKMFSILPDVIDADFYFKVDDDVAVNLDALITYLKAKQGQGNLYAGCMKSGQVLTDKKYKWYEPEYWRFGDPSGDGYINYPRHASGQIYGLSASVARYIGHNAAILHKYANEDVSVGSWLVGLDVLHDDERHFCCESDAHCEQQEDEASLCISYYERQCAGICHSEQRLEGIWKSCLDDPLAKKKVVS